MIRWFAKNDIAANILLLGIIICGVWVAVNKVPLQVNPSWEFNDVFISMNYRGGTADDVERAIVIPIEEAIKDLPAIDSIRSEANEGRGTVWVEIRDGVDMRDILEEIKGRIDRISTFPDETERPVTRIPDSNAFREIITIAVMGELSDEELRRVAERVRDDLTELPEISQAELRSKRPFEIAIEANQEKLRAYGISFSDLSDAVRRSSLDVPAGSIRGEAGRMNVRTKGQAYTREDFASISVKSVNGAEVLLSEVASIIDGFEEDRQIVRFNGRPAALVEVMRHDAENAIKISDAVSEYIAEAPARFPEGIEMEAWDDESIAIEGRLKTLAWSLVQGCVLVFLLLGLFLRPSVAFWVVIGIPVSFAGGIMFMPLWGVTANMMSVFGFIIVLGLVVDDAIVTGENIFSHMRKGGDPLEATVAGTKEVAVPVTFGVLTTVVAFLPLMNMPGHIGTYAKQVPPVVMMVLLFSLVESKLVLPSHLKHVKMQRKDLGPFARFQRAFAVGLERFVERFYQPSLKVATRHRYSVIAVFLAGALLMMGYIKGGHMSFQAMPAVDDMRIRASVDFPNETPLETTDVYVKRIAAVVDQLKEEFTDGEGGPSLILNVYSETGDDGWGLGGIDTTEGDVSIELMAPSMRDEPGPKNSVIAERWKELVGEIPEARQFHIRTAQRRRGGQRGQEPIEIELRGEGSEKKIEIAERIEELFESYDEIADAWSGTDRGQDELEITLKPRAAELGISQQMLGGQLRQAFFGQEAQRVQRGRDDIRVMVRLTKEERETMHTLDTMKIRTPAGAMVALESVAEVSVVKAPDEINRIDGAEVITLGAYPKSQDADIMAIAREAAPKIQELVNEGAGLSYRYTGYIAESEETKKKTIVNALMLLAALYALLAIPFKSAIQPLFVLLAVPFGVIGALLGHMIMDITPSNLSIFGMLALAGVVVNDSLVMVDFINRRRREDGMELKEAVLTAGGARFRPILLTSLTTFVGLMPLIFERSIQAQFLIPMAVSLGFGILFATAITLYLIPAAYLIAEDLGRGLKDGFGFYLKPFRKAEEAPSVAD